MSRGAQGAAARAFAQSLAMASADVEAGRLSIADAIARELLAAAPRDANVLTLMGRVAAAVGEHDVAAEWFRRALAVNPYLKPASRGLAEAERATSAAGAEGTDAWRRARLAAGRPAGFIVMKAWGYGFWSDVNQALGQLLAAEITGRVPVMAWGSNSRFGAPGVSDAWGLFFEPVSSTTLEQVRGAGYTYFPPKWSDENLDGNDVSKWEGQWSRMSGLLLLNRPETVVVGDFQCSAGALANWLPRDHPLAGKGHIAAYRWLVDRFLKPRAEIAAEAEEFRGAHLAGAPTLAVHVRGSDKLGEIPDLGALIQEYHTHIDRAMREMPGCRIFLLTDSTPMLEAFRRRYGDRVVTAQCQRSATRWGVHHDPAYTGDRRRLGVEVLKDALIARACDRFVGLGGSAVSAMISILRDWPPGTCTLIGPDMHLGPSIELYLR
jgi:hypothetical protein